ncbi:hypothetical protein Riv7116_4590 [Rivularia sp. PCC 7116]|uniref:hypothetical protein n=1 Tax=Rivularia sp. PCC 7116 TaxID=373994 RepID=UPI00029ED6D2|nr:hypothetical protein [Rivularia sp. PCC 7116]AFY57009.1 hypothetical protein Riv7116_4590 [Rivularia sp. PCC 7116]
MISLIDSQNSTTNDMAVVQRLARAISLAAAPNALSNGEFSLLLACCNSANKQEEILSVLREFSTVNIRKVILSSKAQTLYSNIVSVLGSTQPDALVVRGLESVESINELIISTNLMRDEFGKQFKFPLVLFINEDILRKLVRLAPDLKDWAASTFRFQNYSQRELIGF